MRKNKDVLWQVDALACAVEGDQSGQWKIVTGLSNDTRDMVRGDLFVALKMHRDGHDFVADALKKGAAGALVSRQPPGLVHDAPLLFVDDVQRGLNRLARAARARMQAKTIAITGSVGKTSTKDMLKLVLSVQRKTFAAKHSFNNHWGVPLALGACPKDTEFAIFEIGMNAPGEIAPLAKMVCPHIALITQIAPAHIGAFNTLDDIAHEKASIFKEVTDGGCAILPTNTPCFNVLNDAAKQAGLCVRRFGNGENSDLYIDDMVHDGDKIRVSLNGVFTGKITFNSYIGNHFIHNALGVLVALYVAGGDCQKACETLERWQPDKGRGSCRHITLASAPNDIPITLIDDTYNANPASVVAGLEKLTSLSGMRHIAILGDMLELGEHSERLHTALAKLPAMEKVTYVHSVGSFMEKLWKHLPAEKRGLNAPDSATLSREIENLVKPGDIIFVKGSLGSNMKLCVDALDKLGHGVKGDYIDDIKR